MKKRCLYGLVLVTLIFVSGCRFENPPQSIKRKKFDQLLQKAPQDLTEDEIQELGDGLKSPDIGLRNKAYDGLKNVLKKAPEKLTEGHISTLLTPPSFDADIGVAYTSSTLLFSVPNSVQCRYTQAHIEALIRALESPHSQFGSNARGQLYY